MIAYFPAFWYSDSFGYLPSAFHPYPFTARPVGYSLLLLWPLRVFHSVAAVAVVQHVFGLLAGVLIYVLLRRRFQFAGWTATLAAAPVLLSAYEIQLEHFMLSDALFMILTVAALVIALWRQVPSILACIAVGLLLGAAAITRTEGLPLIATFAFAVLVSNARFPARLARVAALAVSFALPVLVYAAWFQDVHGNFRLESTYGGAFLAARVEPFADCSVIQPPANERWLCLSTPASRRLPPDQYLWGPAAVTPLARPPTGPAFSARTSAVAEKFAIHAIQHEPLAYSVSVWHTFLQAFKWNSGPYTNGQQTWMFPARRPATVAQLARATGVGTTDQSFYQYNGGRNPDTEFREPWARILRVYQDFAVLVPPALAGIVILGLVGICVAFRRRGGPALLPWITGMLMLVFPAVVSSYEARYVVPTVPFFCVAAALAIREIGNRNQAAGGRLDALGALTGSDTDQRRVVLAGSDPDMTPAAGPACRACDGIDAALELWQKVGVSQIQRIDIDMGPRCVYRNSLLGLLAFAKPIGVTGRLDEMKDMDSKAQSETRDQSLEEEIKNEKIRRAKLAGPSTVTREATVADMDKDGNLTVLRPGTNEWVCVPGDQNIIGKVDMCLDPMGMVWMRDVMAKKPKPTNTSPGLIYMLNGAIQHSFTDPFDTTSPAIPIGPHWMILWPFDAKAAGLSTVMRDAGTMVMFAGTPYAHLHICGSPWEGNEYHPDDRGVWTMTYAKAECSCGHGSSCDCPRGCSCGCND